MGRYTGSMSRLCKRVGVNIVGTPKFDAILAKHFSKRKRARKPSEYALQLREKQLARYMFGISEKQFKKYFLKAHKSQGVTGAELLRNLERRADNVLYRAGIAVTRKDARQMISHGHFELNGHKITIPSILVEPEDILILRKKMETSPRYVGFSQATPLKWIKIDHKKKSLTIERLPEDDELEQIINVQAIIEFYSR